MPRGGARPGAGRKRNAVKYAGPALRAERAIVRALPAALTALLDLASGVVIQETTEDGRRIYSRPPDFRANQYLIDRILGKPSERQQTEVSGPAGAPIAIREMVIERDPNRLPWVPAEAAGS